MFEKYQEEKRIRSSHTEIDIIIEEEIKKSRKLHGKCTKITIKNLKLEYGNQSVNRIQSKLAKIRYRKSHPKPIKNHNRKLHTKSTKLNKQQLRIRNRMDTFFKKTQLIKNHHDKARQNLGF